MCTCPRQSPTAYPWRQRTVADTLSHVNQSLADDIFLLSLSPKGNCRGSKPDTEYALVAAWLTELVRRGRADVDENVHVHDSTPTGDPDLDWALTRLSGERARGPYDLLMRLRDHPWRKVAERLCSQGVVREAKDRLLGLFPVTRYFVVDNGAHREVNYRFRRVVVDGVEPDAHTAALVKLLHAARMSTTLSDMVFSEKVEVRDKLRVQQRMKEISQDDSWASPAAGPAVARIESALWQRSRPASGGG